MERFLERQRGWRGPATALGLGALGAFAMAPFHALPLLWLSVPGLLLLIGRAGGRRRAAWLGLAWGWGFQLVGLYWITEAILLESDRFWWLVPIAVPALAFFMGAYTVLPALAAWGARPGWRRLLAFAGAWVGADFLRGWVLTGFPWNLLGSAWAFDALPIQGAALFGVHGLTLLTVLVAAAPVLGWRGWAGAGGALAAMALFGLWRLWPAEPPPHPISVVLVQGNVGQEVKWQEETRWPIFRRYLDLTREGVETARREAPGTRVVAVWPETASPFLLAQDAEARRIAGAVLPPDGVLLAGTVRAEFGPDGRARRIFNSLVALEADGSLAASYDKSHLVPFGEYMPLGGILPVRVVQGAIDFTPGDGPVAVRAAGLPGFNPLICYEVIFSGEVASAERAGWFVNITNDAWFGRSTGPYQHLAAARLRAVEEGLPMLRAAQTGVSAAFDARGREVGRLGLGRMGAVVVPLPQARPETVFAFSGLWIPGGLILLCLLAAGTGFRDKGNPGWRGKVQ